MKSRRTEFSWNSCQMAKEAYSMLKIWWSLVVLSPPIHLQSHHGALAVFAVPCQVRKRTNAVERSGVSHHMWPSKTHAPIEMFLFWQYGLDVTYVPRNPITLRTVLEKLHTDSTYCGGIKNLDGVTDECAPLVSFSQLGNCTLQKMAFIWDSREHKHFLPLYINWYNFTLNFSSFKKLPCSLFIVDLALLILPVQEFSKQNIDKCQSLSLFFSHIFYPCLSIIS